MLILVRAFGYTDSEKKMLLLRVLIMIDLSSVILCFWEEILLVFAFLKIDLFQKSGNFSPFHFSLIMAAAKAKSSILLAKNILSETCKTSDQLLLEKGRGRINSGF